MFNGLRVNFKNKTVFRLIESLLFKDDIIYHQDRDNSIQGLLEGKFKVFDKTYSKGNFNWGILCRYQPILPNSKK